jgi:hypothetical protein
MNRVEHRVEPFSIEMANHRIVYPYHLNLKELRPLFIETEKSSCCPRFRNAEKNKDKIIMTLFAKLVLEKSRRKPTHYHFTVAPNKSRSSFKSLQKN